MKRSRYIVGLVVAASFAFFTFSNVDWHSVQSNIASVGPESILLALCALFTGYLIRVLRWKLLLKSANVSVGASRLAGPFLASFALNNLVPARAGDALRVFGFVREIGVRSSVLMATVIAERFYDLATLLLLCLFGVLLTGGFQRQPAFPFVVFLWCLAIIFGFVFTVLLYRWVAHILLRIKTLGFVSRSNLLVKIISFSLRNLIIVGKLSRKNLAPLAVLSLLAWLSEAAIFLVIANAVGIDMTLGNMLLATGLATLMTLIPGTPGHIGTFDFGARAGFLAGGATMSQAVSATIIVHVLLWLPITMVGGFYLLQLWLKKSAMKIPADA